MGQDGVPMGREPAVLHEIRSQVAVMILNRPDDRNRMTPELLDDFGRTADRLRAEPGVRCVVVTGRGSCFSAGVDPRPAVQREDDGVPRQPHERSHATYEPLPRVLDYEVRSSGASGARLTAGRPDG